MGCPASFSHVARTFGVNRPLEANSVSRNSVEIVQEAVVLGRPGNDLLSRVLRHSTIGAEEFNGRVRDGIGFFSSSLKSPDRRRTNRQGREAAPA